MTTTDVADTSKPVLDADKSRLLHTMIRVRDLDASLNFYSNLLGMKVLRKRDYPTGKFTLAIGVPDVYKACERLAAAGVKIPRPAGPMAHGGSVIAFIEDPDGYRIELIERS